MVDRYKTFLVSSSNIFPLCMGDDNQLVGHLILRFASTTEMCIGFEKVESEEDDYSIFDEQWKCIELKYKNHKKQS